jgi:hypothetical protein
VLLVATRNQIIQHRREIEGLPKAYAEMLFQRSGVVCGFFKSGDF